MCIKICDLVPISKTTHTKFLRTLRIIDVVLKCYSSGERIRDSNAFIYLLAGWPAVRWRHICNQPKDSTVIFLKTILYFCAREKEKLPTLNKKFNLLYYLVIFSWYSRRIKTEICVKHKYRSGKRYCAEVEQIFKIEEGCSHVRRREGVV